jgi:hypothetical protein
LDSSLVQFEEPLRTTRGRVAKGSMLHSRDTCVPFSSGLIHTSNQTSPSSSSMRTAMPGVQEFEAWLVADPDALKSVLRKPLSPPKPPEKLSRREAKELLQQWCEEHAASRDPAELRRNLAEQCDLDTLAQKCTAFASFLRRLEPPHS